MKSALSPLMKMRALSAPFHSPDRPRTRRLVANEATAAQTDLWVRIQWRSGDLLFDFQTYPNYQKLPQFTNKSTTATQNLRAHISFARH